MKEETKESHSLSLTTTCSSVLYFFREEGWQSGNFTTNLIRAIAAADSNNFQKMLRAFPNYASAVWLAQNDEDGIDFLRSFAQH